MSLGRTKSVPRKVKTHHKFPIAYFAVFGGNKPITWRLCLYTKHPVWNVPATSNVSWESKIMRVSTVGIYHWLYVFTVRKQDGCFEPGNISMGGGCRNVGTAVYWPPQHDDQNNKPWQRLTVFQCTGCQIFNETMIDWKVWNELLYIVVFLDILVSL